MVGSFNFIIILLASLLVLVQVIVVLRFILKKNNKTANLQSDALLKEWMHKVEIFTWEALHEKSGLSSSAIWQVRNGEAAALKLSELTQLATVLDIPIFEFLEKLNLLPENLELKASRQECLELQQQLQQLVSQKEAIRQEGLRLHQELQQQRTELTEEFRALTFEQLQTLLTNYPNIPQMVRVKPELPAKNLISMFTPLDNLLQTWGYEQIGKPWEHVPYNPLLHQPDTGDINEGELVYIRFVGYQHQEYILCPAKVSRTLPGGAK